MVLYNAKAPYNIRLCYFHRNWTQMMEKTWRWTRMVMEFSVQQTAREQPCLSQSYTIDQSALRIDLLDHGHPTIPLFHSGL
jgi:hypothetical protein